MRNKHLTTYNKIINIYLVETKAKPMAAVTIYMDEKQEATYFEYSYYPS
jgi:type IV secretory pathway component VirB8